MHHLGRPAGQVTVTLLAACLLAPAAFGGRDKLAASIEQRLDQAGNLTFPMTPLSDYFEGDTVKPESGFYVYAGLHSRQSFRFSVVVYKTAAQAAAAYKQAVDHVRAIGGDFHAFNVMRSGRVLYMGSTAGGPDPSNPALPVKAFHALITLADGRF
jgi:hypothetical protein